MSNLKLVAGTVKRRGIAIAAAVAVAGGSLATANYAMAVETEPTLQELEAEFSGTDAGNTAAKSAFDAAKALKAGLSVEKVQQILQDGLQTAAGQDGAGFTQEELKQAEQTQLNEELKSAAEAAKKKFEQKNGTQSEAPSAPAQNPAAEWATPAPAGKPSPQRLEAEFGNTPQGAVAEKTAKKLAEALRNGTTKQQLEQIVKDSFAEAGFDEEIDPSFIDEFVTQAFTRYGEAKAELDVKKNSALDELAPLGKINPLQRQIFEDQIKAAVTQDEINKVVNAAKAENANPVQQFAPVPGQKSPGKAGEQTDVEKALAHTKQEALEKLKDFTFLTQQQKDAYKQQVEAATQVYQVEAAFETGEAKNTANKAAKEATNFVGKALARTKQLALKQLDEMTGLNHEQKREARKKIVDADQVYKVEAAFHTAEKLNKAAKK